ncbi:MAG: DeoR/GlpR family transcriptional regulator of sugar metabolism [Colwellia sp.]|jgi:DeoR/GlpR family transcriptional regulator of sugar metabolism
MSKRNTQQRRHSIISELNEHGEVSVDSLAKKFATSEVTIRKDLAALENSGLLLRRYGGAVPLPRDIIEHKSEKVSKRKVSIASKAATLIRDHNRIIIDSGSTTSALVKELNSKQGLIVMTNSLAIASDLHALENEPTLLMTGGTWDTHSESFQGQIAESVLRSYDFDQLFIGADGIDIERGTTTFNELLGLSRVMADVSREVIVLVESEKINRKIPNVEIPWKNIDILITDADLSDELKAKLLEQDVNLLIAK